MTLPEALEVLRQHQAWRRDDTGELDMLAPKVVGEALDFAIAYLSNLSGLAIPGRDYHCDLRLPACDVGTCPIEATNPFNPLAHEQTR